jgi:GT2 family glycosyltransferase
MQNVTVVIVNFESGNRLDGLLERLAGEQTPVIVIDNASSDDSLAPAAAPRSGVELIRNERNVGFAAAANQGAAVAGPSEWILFLNPDVVIDPGFVGELVADAGANVGAIAPVQVDHIGRALAESGGYDPTLGRFAVWALLPRAAWGRHGPWLSNPTLGTDVAVDWVSGAAMAVRREVFERLHGFDDRYFLFMEDADLGHRIRTAGYRVLLRSSVRVRHEVGQAEEGSRAATRGREFARSVAMGFEPGWRRRKLGAILSIGFAWRSLRPGPRGATARGALGPSLDLWFGRGQSPSGPDEPKQ